MTQQKYGNIVNISSGVGAEAAYIGGGLWRCKAAVTNFTKYLAIELATKYGTKVSAVNAITPGFFITEQNRAFTQQSDGTFTARGNAIISSYPFSRFGEPEELLGTLYWIGK